MNYDPVKYKGKNLDRFDYFFKKLALNLQKEIDSVFNENLHKIQWKINKEIEKNEDINENLFVTPTSAHTERYI